MGSGFGLFFFFTSHVRPELSRGTARLLVKCQVAMRTGILFFKEGTSNDSATVPVDAPILRFVPLRKDLRILRSCNADRTANTFGLGSSTPRKGRKEIGKKIRYTGRGLEAMAYPSIDPIVILFRLVRSLASLVSLFARSYSVAVSDPFTKQSR